MDDATVDEHRSSTEVASSRRAASRWIAVVGLVIAVVVGVAGVNAALGEDGVDDRLLVVDDAGTVSLLDPAAGSVVFEVDDGVVTPDRSALFTTAVTGDGPVLQSRDPATGDVTGTTAIPEGREVRVVSADGDAVVLMAPRPAGHELYEPEQRSMTELTIAFTDERPPIDHTLDGNFEPETLSVDESTLFLLQYWPPLEPDRYFVRQLDLATGEISDVATPQVELQPEMRGVAREQTIHPDGHFLYTLYTLPAGAEPVHDVEADPGSDTDRWAFVHVLSLDEGWSFCIFLPVPIGTGDEATVGLGMDPAGAELTVVDPSTQTVARIDAESMEVTDVRSVPALRATERERAQIAVTDDGTTYVSNGWSILELVGEEMTPTAAWAHERRVSGLSTSPDGSQLRFGRDGSVVLFDRASGREVGQLRAPGGGDLSLLGPPSGAVTEIPLECAC
ncbi:MAG: hypothetical protein AAFZ07_03300 [Actinomycetota bacterium]